MMTLSSFKESLSATIPPPGITVYLQALWYDGRNDWEKSHELIQDIPDVTAARIHAYLHRKEGDIANADYWYRSAHRKRPAITLQEEWEELVNSQL